MNKYRNRKTVCNGITFDSQREAIRYAELKLLEKSGMISELELQPKFRHKGETVRAITYKAANIRIILQD